TSAITALVSSPFAFSCPIVFESALRFACRDSVAVCSDFRRASSASKAVASSSKPRRARRARTDSRSFLRRLGSSILGVRVESGTGPAGCGWPGPEMVSAPPGRARLAALAVVPGADPARLAGLLVELAQEGELLPDLRLEPARDGPVPVRLRHPAGKRALARGVGMGLVVRIPVGMPVAELAHELRRRIAQVHRHLAAAVLLHEGAGRVVGVVAGVAL